MLTPIDVINEIIKKKCETWPANEFGILQVAKIEDALLVQQLCLNFLPDILRDLAQNPTTDFQKCKEDLKNKITAHFAKHCGRPLSITGAILSAGVEDCLFQKLREILPK